MKIAVVGASGYTGLELVRIVLRHPQLELVAVTSEQRAGQALGEAFPALRGLSDLCLEAVDPAALASRVDAAFTALPHGTSAGVVSELHKAGVVVVDLSADFRLRSREEFDAWYGEHQAPELFGQAVYGLPEIYGPDLPGARLVAAPDKIRAELGWDLQHSSLKNILQTSWEWHREHPEGYTPV